MEGYFQFEHVDSLYNSLFPFPLVTAKLIGDVLYTNFLTISPLPFALPIQDVNIHKAIGIGGTMVYFLNRQGGSNLQDGDSNSEDFADFWGILLALPVGGVIAERNILSRVAYSSRCRLLINLAVAIGNGNTFFKQKVHVQMANNNRSPQSHTKAQP
jgi:hypothetical protein